MTKERRYYIAYEICSYIKDCDTLNQFKDYEFCMYVANMANNIKYAIKNNDSSVLKPYYEALKYKHTKRTKELIELLDEWKKYLYVYKSVV